MIALLEEVPPSTVMWTTTEGSFSAGEIIEQLEAGEELGKQYASDVLRVTRDFMARQVHKEKKKDLLFTYPVFISTVADEKVTVVVSVDGRDMVVLVPANDFSFPIHEDMRCMVEGWRNKDGQKYLHFREIVPLQLDEEHSELLREIVECFKPG
jgi:DnaJ-class molecular chaperone